MVRKLGTFHCCFFHSIYVSFVMRNLVNIPTVLEEMRCAGVEGIHVRHLWHVPVNTKPEALISIKGTKFLH